MIVHGAIGASASGARSLEHHLFETLPAVPDASGTRPAPTVTDVVAGRRARRHATSLSARVGELLAADHVGARAPLMACIEARGGCVHGLTLLLMADAFDGDDSGAVLDAAAAVELAAVAPDCLRGIADGSVTDRDRGRNMIALLAADWALATGLQAATVVSARHISAFAAIIRNLWDAEILVRNQREAARPLSASYLELVARPRSELLAFAARLGVALAGAGPRDEAVAATFGERLGLAMQMAEEERRSVQVGGDPRAGEAAVQVACARRALGHLPSTGERALHEVASLPLVRLEERRGRFAAERQAG